MVGCTCTLTRDTVQSTGCGGLYIPDGEAVLALHVFNEPVHLLALWVEPDQQDLPHVRMLHGQAVT